MTGLLLAVSAAAAAAYVLAPLARPAGAPAADATADVRARRDALLAALREADEDRAAGKISEAEHAAERSRLEAEAAGVLRALEAAAPAAPPPAAGAAAFGRRFCTACGAEAAPAHRFCAACGARLEAPRP